MKGLIRQLKLHGLVRDNIPTDGRVARIHTFFAELFDGMIVEVIPEYHPENIIFHKDGKFYMEQNSSKNWLCCRWSGYWFVLGKEHGLSVDERRVVIKYMVERHFTRLQRVPRSCGTQVGTPPPRGWHNVENVELYL